MVIEAFQNKRGGIWEADLSLFLRTSAYADRRIPQRVTWGTWEPKQSSKIPVTSAATLLLALHDRSNRPIPETFARLRSTVQFKLIIV